MQTAWFSMDELVIVTLRSTHLRACSTYLHPFSCKVHVNKGSNCSKKQSAACPYTKTIRTDFWVSKLFYGFSVSFITSDERILLTVCLVACEDFPRNKDNWSKILFFFQLLEGFMMQFVRFQGFSHLLLRCIVKLSQMLAQQNRKGIMYLA